MSETLRPSPAQPGTILRTKLMPPRLHAGLISRPELLARLDEALVKKLAFIVAPAGFGKTTLVSQWLAERNLPFAWLTLDENDNEPARFWTYLISALRSFDAEIGNIALAALMSPTPAYRQGILVPLINDLASLTGSQALVLDDFHAVTAPEIHALLAFLLEHLPPSLHIVLISRRLSEMPLAVLRVRDELVELDAASLRFSLAETERFLRQAAPAPLPAGWIDQLQQRTDGWAAGLRLAVLYLRNAPRAEDQEKWLAAFSGDHRYVADYLIQEVFAQQPPEAQDFLLKTCFLSRLTAALCDEAAQISHSAAMLETLERDHVFMTQLERSAGRIWYRYNPLFAESIQYLARRRLGEAEIRAIYERASLWYEGQHLYDEAIESALAAASSSHAIALIEKFIEIHSLTELHTLNRWLQEIPTSEIFSHPQICFTYAQVILYGTPDRFAPATAARLEPFLNAAEQVWRMQGEPQMLGELLSFRGLVSWWQGDFQAAFGYARQSLDRIPEHDLFWRGNSLLIGGTEDLNLGRILDAQDKVLEARALLGAAQNIYGVLAAMQMLSDIFFWQGDLEQAAQLAQQVLADAVGDESMLDDQGMASLSLAQVAYERNDLSQAEQHAARAMELGRQRGNALLQAQAAVRQAYLLAARNDFPASEELLKRSVADIQNPMLLRDVQQAQVHLSILSGAGRALPAWQALAAGARPAPVDVQAERLVFNLTRLRLTQGKAGEALDLLEGRVLDAVENGRLRSQVTALILSAIAQRALSNRFEALKSLSEALAIGQFRGFRRLFLDEGGRFIDLLQDALPSLAGRSLHVYAAALLHAANPAWAAAQGPGLLMEPLSQQEQRVLRLLVAGLSNQAIAQELVVSINTVKTHVKNIYRKLNVRSRDEVRRAARELKLF